MNPEDLGLPAKFDRWRPIDRTRSQYDVIVAAACSDKRFVIINAPTGIGKTAIYLGLASLLGGRGAVLTQTKGLQSQIAAEFQPMGLVEVKGQSNYPCLYFEDDVERGVRKALPGCDEGPCHAGVKCLLKDSGCRYYGAVRRAASSRYMVTNYAYWMTMQRYAEPGTLGGFSTLVLDEAHDAASALAEFVKITIDRGVVERFLGMTAPKDATISEWVDWADHALKECRDRLDSARDTVHMYRQSITIVRKLQELMGELTNLSAAESWKRIDTPDPPAWVPGTATDWIIDDSKKEVVFQPVWASGYAEQYLFANIPKVILVSATVTPRDAGFMGLSKTDYDYFQYPSPFKVAIRPVYSLRSARVGRSMTSGEERLWINRIDQIIQKEAIDGKAKGIIHARSYDRARTIFAKSRFKDLLMIHDPKNTRDTVAKFKLAKPPRVLISPAVGTGYDFPMDEARFIIIAKVPFIDNRPAVIRARHKSDKRYLDYVAMVDLIQMAGRGVRSETDMCRTYIVDDNWGDWFYPRNKGIVPNWFKAAVKRIGSLNEVT